MFFPSVFCSYFGIVFLYTQTYDINLLIFSIVYIPKKFFHKGWVIIHLNCLLELLLDLFPFQLLAGFPGTIYWNTDSFLPYLWVKFWYTNINKYILGLVSSENSGKKNSFLIYWVVIFIISFPSLFLSFFKILFIYF